MAGFLGDIVVERGLEDGVIVVQPRPGGLHQRHGVADVVIGLGQIGDVGVAADAAGQAVPDRGDGGEGGPLGCGRGDQGFKKRHANSQAACEGEGA